MLWRRQWVNWVSWIIQGRPTPWNGISPNLSEWFTVLVLQPAKQLFTEQFRELHLDYFAFHCNDADILCMVGSPLHSASKNFTIKTASVRPPTLYTGECSVGGRMHVIRTTSYCFLPLLHLCLTLSSAFSWMSSLFCTPTQPPVCFPYLSPWQMIILCYTNCTNLTVTLAFGSPTKPF